MKPKKSPKNIPQPEFFRVELVNMIDMKHALVMLSNTINWSELEQYFSQPFTENIGAPAKPVRLMAGLHYIKHMYNLSDEQVVLRWIENPYWQYFCGEKYFIYKAPIDPSSMTRWRKMFGEEGVEKLLSATIQAGLSCGAIKQKSFDNVIVDTTVQEKAIAYPTDAKLYHKMRIRLVSIAKKYEIALRQSYERVGKKAFVNCNRHFHGKRNNQAEQELRHLKTMLTRVRNDIVRKIRNNDNLKSEFQEILDLADRLLVQKRDDKKKLYSIHAPEVECISKGKVRKQYEFGNKVSITTTSKEGFVIGALGLHGNPYDGHTLAMSVRQCERLISRKLKNIWVDLGFRGHDYIGSATVNLCGFGVELPGNLSRSQRRLYKRRASIEPIIGHMKNDGRLGRNYLLGVEGDKMNVILCACGQNLRLLANWFREFFGLLINLVRILVKTASFWLKSRRVLPVLAMAQ